MLKTFKGLPIASSDLRITREGQVIGTTGDRDILEGLMVISKDLRLWRSSSPALRQHQRHGEGDGIGAAGPHRSGEARGPVRGAVAEHEGGAGQHGAGAVDRAGIVG